MSVTFDLGPVRGMRPEERPDSQPDFGTMYSQYVEDARRAQNDQALMGNMVDAYDSINDRVKAATGTELMNPFRANAPTAYDRSAGAPGFAGAIKALDPHAEWKRQIDELRTKHADALPWDDVLSEPERAALAKMKEVRDATNRMSQAAGLADPKEGPLGGIPILGSVAAFGTNLVRNPTATAAQVLGGLRGSLYSAPDAIGNVLGFTLPGAASKSLIKNATMNALSNAGVQAILSGGKQADYKAAGLPYGWKVWLEEVEGAAATGFALDLAVRAPARGIISRFGRDTPADTLLSRNTERGGLFLDAVTDATPTPRPRDQLQIDSETIRRAEAGDVAASREILQKTGALEDPAVRYAVDHMEAGGKLSEDARRALNAIGLDDYATGKHMADLAIALRMGDLANALESFPEPIRPAPEPLQREQGAALMERLDRAELRLESLPPQLAQVVQDGLEAGIPRIVKAVQEAANSGPESFPAKLSEVLDARTVAEARIHGGRAGPLEIAQSIRQFPDLIDENVNVEHGPIAAGRTIAGMEDAAFAEVSRGAVPSEVAVMIAERVPREVQARMVMDLEQAKPGSIVEAADIIEALMPPRVPPGAVEPRTGSPIDDPAGPAAKAQVEALKGEAGQAYVDAMAPIARRDELESQIETLRGQLAKIEMEAGKDKLAALRDGDQGKLTGDESIATNRVMTRDELAASIASKLREAIDADDGYHYGLRVTEQPLTVGEIAAPSKQWYSDFISEDDPDFGRAAYPDHDTDLDGSSAIGVAGSSDIELALAAAGVAKTTKKKNRYGYGHYAGEYVSIIRSDRIVDGSDPGEWIMRDAEVVASWSFPPSDKVEAGLNRNNSNVLAAKSGSKDVLASFRDDAKPKDAEGDGTSPAEQMAVMRQQLDALERELAQLQAELDPTPDGQVLARLAMRALDMRRQQDIAAAVNDALRLVQQLTPAGTRIDAMPDDGMIYRAANGDRYQLDATSDMQTGHIQLAMSAMDPAARMGHEAVHTLVTMGHLSPAEVSALSSLAREAKTFKNEARYRKAYEGRADLDRVIEEEAAASYIEARIRGDVQGPANTVVERVRQLIERVRQMLAGYGFQSREDVVQAVMSGDAARRQARADWARNALRSEDITAAATDGERLFAFAGERAKTADLQALSRAQEMDAAGADRTEIWTSTGWFKGVDGRWRFEIDDRFARWRSSMALEGDTNVLGNFMDHRQVFDAYPDLQFIRASMLDEGTYYDPIGRQLNVEMQSRATTAALHELQHAVQYNEGFATGGDGLGSMGAYTRLAGEVEARAVEKRMDLTPEQRRARPPWMDYDVPEAKQIVRMPEGGQKLFAMRDGDLDMSQEARKQRAEAMGFDTDKVYYHGTASTFDAFKASQIGKVFGADKEGFFFTNNPSDDMASGYAVRASDDRGGNGASVMPVHLRMKNPFTLDDYARALGYEGPRNVLDGRGLIGWFDGNKDRVLTLAKAGGHDGLVFVDPDSSLTSGAAKGQPESIAVVFDPSNIRSVNAEFDPAKSGSAQLLAAMREPEPMLKTDMAQVDRMNRIGELIEVCRS